MKLFKRIFLAAATGAALSLAHAGGVTDTEIVVGSHIDLSGPVAAGMPMLRNAMQMRLDEARHARDAEAEGAVPPPAPVAMAMRAVARVMTGTAYYI